MPTCDPEFLAQIRKLPCMACGSIGSTEAHHIKTRGSGGGDDPWNILPLCSYHHTLSPFAWHRGPRQFLMAFPRVEEHVKKLGWEILNGKLYNAKYSQDIGVLKQKEYRKTSKRR